MPSGQAANACPTRASSESRRANSRRAADRRPSAYSRAARRRATASGSARTPSSSVNGGAPGRGVGPGGDTLGRVGLDRGDPDHDGRGGRSRGRGDGDDTRPGRHGATVAASRPTRCLDRSPMPSGRGRDAMSSVGPSAAAGRPALAIFRKVMPTYRELLAQARAEIDEISTPEAHALSESDEQPLFVDVRPPRRVGRGTPTRRDPPSAQQPGVACRGADRGQDAPARRLLRERPSVRLRDEEPRRARVRERGQPRRRLRRLEAERLPVRHAASRSPRRSASATRATCSSPRSAKKASRSCSTRASS